MKEVERERRWWLAGDVEAPKISNGKGRWLDLVGWFSGEWRHHTIADDLVIGFGLGTVLAGIADRLFVADATQGWASLAMIVFGAITAAIVAWYALTPWGRARWCRAHLIAKIERYADEQILRPFDLVIATKAGFAPGSVHLDGVGLGPHFDADGEPLNPFITDPSGASETPPMSVLPVGPKPATIPLTVSTAVKAGTVAGGLVKAFGYAYAEIVKSDANAQQLTVELHLGPRPQPRMIKPVELDPAYSPADLFQGLCAELGLGDAHGQFPRIKPGSLVMIDAADHVLEPAGQTDDPVLAWRPSGLEFSLIPTPLQTDPKVRDNIMETVAARLGYIDAEREDWDPVEGIRVILYRDGKPPLFPLPIACLKTNWAEVAEIVFADDKFVVNLLDITVHPGISEEINPPPVDMLQIIEWPRPDRVDLALDCPARDVPVVLARLRTWFSYHVVDGVHSDKTGLLVTMYRDQHQPGRRLNLDTLCQERLRLRVGSNYSGDGIEYWDLVNEAWVGVVGATGSGKGDNILAALAVAMRLLWTPVYISGKPYTAEAQALTSGLLQADGTNPEACVAVLELLALDITVRSWKMEQAGQSFRHISEFRKWYAAELAASRDPGLPIGADVMLAFDEPGQIVDGKLIVNGDKALATRAAGYTAFITSKGRWAGYHGMLASQMGNYPNLGGPLVVANLLRRIQLWSLKKEDYQAFGIDSHQRETLDATREIRRRQHVAANLDGEPIVAGHGFSIGDKGVREIQLDWAVDAKWLAPQVVPAFRAAFPAFDPTWKRDPIAELEAAREVYGEATDADLAAVDHARHPAVVSLDPFQSVGEPLTAALLDTPGDANG